jgi:chromosome segregation ATPase
MADNRIEYRVDIVGADQTQAELDRLNSKVKGTGDAVADTDKKIKQMEKDIAAFTAAIKNGTGNVAAYERQLEQLTSQYNSLTGVVGKATQGMEQVKGKTANVGQAALEASRGIEDLQYGFGGVVNNIPSLVMAFGGGAGITAAISLAAIGVNQLVKHMDEFETAADRARDRAEAFAEAVAEMRNVVKGEANEYVEGLDQTLEELKAQNKGFGLESYDQKKVEATDRLSEATQRLTENQQRLEIANKKIAEQEEIANRRAVSTDQKIAQAKAQEKITSLRLEQASAQINVDKFTEVVNKAELRLDEIKREATKGAGLKADDEAKKEAEKEAKKAEREAKAEAKRREKEIERQKQDFVERENRTEKNRADKEQRELDAMERHNDKKAELEGKHQEEVQRMNYDLQVKWGKYLEQNKKYSLDRQFEEQERFYAQVEQQAERYTGALIGLTENYIEMKISGEEEAELALVSSISRVAGQALIGYGIQSWGAAAAYAARQEWGSAAAAFGIGALLNVAGIGLGGVAYALDFGMSQRKETQSEALKTQEEAQKAARKEAGLSRRSRGGGGGGSDGPLVVNVSYGAGGPMPEDIAREIAKVVKQSDRRRGG